jgi:hypothetical protein
MMVYSLICGGLLCSHGGSVPKNYKSMIKGLLFCKFEIKVVISIQNTKKRNNNMEIGLDILGCLMNLFAAGIKPSSTTEVRLAFYIKSILVLA